MLTVVKWHQTVCWAPTLRRWCHHLRPVVVKPRHGSLAAPKRPFHVLPSNIPGANSCFVFLWPSPQETDQEELLQSIDAATGEDRSWERECWQLSQVPRGAVLQPMYSIAVDPKSGPRSRAAPMATRLKVDIFWFNRETPEISMKQSLTTMVSTCINRYQHLLGWILDIILKNLPAACCAALGAQGASSLWPSGGCYTQHPSTATVGVPDTRFGTAPLCFQNFF